MTRPTAAQVIAAEARFVEEGHHARFNTDRHCLVIKSDTRPGVEYDVVIAPSPGGNLIGTCTCPAGLHAAHGSANCKHIAGGLRRLERERLARFTDGRWVVAPKLSEVA